MCHLGDDLRAVDVRREAFERPLDDELHADCCRQAEDDVAAAHYIVDEVVVQDGAEDELDVPPVEEVLDVLVAPVERLSRRMT